MLSLWSVLRGNLWRCVAGAGRVILRLALVACLEVGVVVVALGYVPRPERVFVGGLLVVCG